jgi:serine/threonine protein kinase
MASSVSVKHSFAAENAMKTSVHLCCCEQLSYAGQVPQEQAYRQTSPASNMYALGCLLFFALTGRKPARFANEELRASFERDIGVNPKMSKLLQCLLEPVAENRPTASQVWSQEFCLHLHVKWVFGIVLVQIVSRPLVHCTQQQHSFVCHRGRFAGSSLFHEPVFPIQPLMVEVFRSDNSFSSIFLILA